MSQTTTSRSRPRRTRRGGPPADADPVLSLTIRWGSATGTLLAVWLVRIIAMALLPLRFLGAACVVFISSLVKGCWREAFEIRKEHAARKTVKRAEQAADAPLLRHRSPDR